MNNAKDMQVLRRAILARPSVSPLLQRSLLRSERTRGRSRSDQSGCRKTNGIIRSTKIPCFVKLQYISDTRDSKGVT